MPLLTLTSDIGHQDYLVGAVKAQLLQINMGFTIVDISHNISPFNYPQAAYICRSAIKSFPEFSYHIILINLFEKKPEQLLLAFHNNQYLLCADNGLLNMILEEKPEMVIGIPLDKLAIKNTLYCASIMGNVVNQLIQGESVKNIGVADVSYREKKSFTPTA
ncbi:MAG: SAM-dependent chlorinase/fluorinase [Bacteroidota bacterium]